LGLAAGEGLDDATRTVVVGECGAEGFARDSVGCTLVGHGSRSLSAGEDHSGCAALGERISFADGAKHSVALGNGLEVKESNAFHLGGEAEADRMRTWPANGSAAVPRLLEGYLLVVLNGERVAVPFCRAPDLVLHSELPPPPPPHPEARRCAHCGRDPFSLAPDPDEKTELAEGDADGAF